MTKVGMTNHRFSRNCIKKTALKLKKSGLITFRYLKKVTFEITAVRSAEYIYLMILQIIIRQASSFKELTCKRDNESNSSYRTIYFHNSSYDDVSCLLEIIKNLSVFYVVLIFNIIRYEMSIQDTKTQRNNGRFKLATFLNSNL